MQKIDLLPCPFCGGKAETFPFDKYDSYGNHERLWYSECGECFALSGYYNTEGEAAIAWNTRASGWIPCSERLPKETGLLNGYLCSIGDCITIMPFFDGKFQEWMDNGKFIVPDPYVEFWMPLPKSPEEEVK